MVRNYTIKLLSLTTVLIIFNSVSIYSQSELQTSLYNFVIEDDGSVFYKKIFSFEKDITEEKIINYFINLPNIKFDEGDIIRQTVVGTNGDVNGVLNSLVISPKKYGIEFEEFSFDNKILLNANLILQFKNNRYRVLIHSFELREVGDAIFTTFEMDFIEDGEFINHTDLRRILQTVNLHLNDLFTVKSEEVDW